MKKTKRKKNKNNESVTRENMVSKAEDIPVIWDGSDPFQDEKKTEMSDEECREKRICRCGGSIWVINGRYICAHWCGADYGPADD